MITRSVDWKRVLDLGFTVASAPVVVAVAGVMALALAFELRGSPFFFQTRIGRGGRPFTMVKLRTMRAAGPGDVKTYEIRDWDSFVFSPPGQRDPRITRLGHFARRTSIDELPNLWNVLKGEMSLVGPRPEIPEIVAQYPPEYHRRHRVLPGITGLAQVSGRSDLAYSEGIKYDLAYVDDHSVLTDLKILVGTIRLGLSGAGAR